MPTSKKFHMLSGSFVILFADCLPAVGAILRRPVPLRLVAVLWDSVARRLRVGASRLGLTARGCWVGAVVTPSAGRRWWVRAIVGSVRVGRVGAVAGVVARTVGLVRSVGGGVGDHDCGGLTVAESDGGSFGCV